MGIIGKRVDANDNIADDMGTMPLWIAAHGFFEITQYLISKGAKVNVIPFAEDANYSPLYGAATNGFEDIVELLLKNKADPNAVGVHIKVPPLYSAAQNNHSKIVELLLENYKTYPHLKTNVDLKTKQDETSLLAAVEQTVSVNTTQAELANKIIIRKLLDAGTKVNQLRKDKRTPLFHLIRLAEQKFNPHIEKIIRLLCQYGADLNLYNEDNKTALSTAIYFKNLALARLLIELGASIDKPIKAMLDKDVGLYETTPLIFAVQLNYVPIIRLLIEKQAKVNQRDKFNTTALQLACKIGNEEVVKLLLPKADINQKGQHGDSPLATAIEYQQIDIIKLLLKQKGINPQQKNDKGAQAIHKVAAKNNLDIIELLASHVDLNAQMNNGETPLFLAAQDGHTKIVDYLLTHGADPEKERSDGTIAIGIAYLLQHKEVVELLLNRYYKGLFASHQNAPLRYDDIALLKENKAIAILPMPLQKLLLKIKETYESKTVPKPITDKSLSPSDKVSQSGYSFLKGMGFTAPEIEALQQTESLEQPTIIEQPKAVVTWLQGKISADMPEIAAIEAGITKTPNCYLYIDTQSLTQQGCKDIANFTSIIPRFCAESGEQGLKPLKGLSLKAQVRINNTNMDVEFTHELKTLTGPARVLCFALRGDDGSTLYIASLHLENGLHKHADAKNIETSLTSKDLTVHLPQEEKIPSTSLRK